ncbi:hypothetical protein NL490_27900, partial [Klebsiella pneumoniae]|nr:hypothetical protein [Klebsiella pneumoniae]
DNWPAVVGIIAGILAKEVVVGTLNALAEGEVEEDLSSLELIKRGFVSVHENVYHELKGVWLLNFPHANLNTAQLEVNSELD